MHELSLCQSAVEIIQRQAEQHDVKRVTAVWLEIGALSCVEESAVRFSFEIVCLERLRAFISSPAGIGPWWKFSTMRCPLCHGVDRDGR